MSEQGLGSVASQRRVGRFTLVDLVEERHGCQVWRAVDSTLNREVALWLVPRDHEAVPELEQATRTAATVNDRRIARILDVFRDDAHLAIVTEWVRGEVLRDHLADPMPPAEAGRVAYELARGIESAHAAGIAHGRIRPASVVVTPEGEIRLVGLGIDAVITGMEPVAAGDPVAADLHGIGAILYACLTGRWPDGRADGIPASPEVGGHVPPPSRILADVPESLDDICARTVITVVPPRGRPVLTSAAQARELLGASLTDLTGQRRPYRAERPSGTPVLPLVATATGIVVLVLLLGWLGWRLLGRDATPVAQPTETSSSPTARPSSPSAQPEPVTYRIVAARDFDPLGNGEENPGRVPFAYDGDRNTARRTVGSSVANRAS